MRRKTCLLTLGICLAIMIRFAEAEERFGAVVYADATYDAGISEFLKQISPRAAAYRTSHSLGKVVAFYKEQAGYKLIGDPTNETAMFRKGNVDVAIQSPYMDTKTGKMMKDTLISIVVQPE